MLYYNCETKDKGYCYDKIRLNFNMSANEFKKLLPINDLLKEADSFVVSNSSYEAQAYGLIAKIEMVAPSRKCLEILDKHIPHTVMMKISKLEIAEDTFYETEWDALYTFHKRLQTIRKKYTSDHFIYDQLYEKGKCERKITSNKHFSPITGYFGSNNFKYATYPRLSKINNRPCIHAEWRINGASHIKTKTGIVSIRDLIKFDLLKFFNEQDKRYIIYESIDLTKLGCWLIGWNRRKSFSKRDLIKMGIMGRIFCNVYDIKSYADLVSHLMNTKKDLENKNRRGRKTNYEERFLSLINYGKFSVKRSAYNNVSYSINIPSITLI